MATIPIIIGTILALLGFLQWPRGGTDLLRPRFVVPLLMWASIYPHYLLQDPDTLGIYESFHLAADVPAMWFGCYCLACFWIGYVLPLGGWISQMFSMMPRGLSVDPEKLRTLAVIACLTPFLVQFAITGTAIFKASEFQFAAGRFWLPLRAVQMIGVAIGMIGIVGAVLIGFSWPAKERRSGPLLFLHLFCLALVMHVFISRFSRAAGITLLLAYGAASMRFGRIRVLLGVVLVFITLLLAHTGITGRPIYGHFSGSYYFIVHLFTYSIWHPIEVLRIGMGSGDALQPLAVIIRGVETTDINALSPIRWLWFQIPIPRALGLPAWTTDASYIIGGYHAHPFWFTMSIFGDLYAHFGRLGALGFAWVGIAYRFVDQLVARFGKSVEEQTLEQYYYRVGHRLAPGVTFRHLNFYLLYMIATYAALNRGLFNSFRSWWIGFMYLTYMMIMVQVALKFVGTRQR